MFDTRTTPYAALLMRLTLGTLFLAHFGLKFLFLLPQVLRNSSLRWVCLLVWPTLLWRWS
ncbi:hypothetical protein VRC25_00775 [Erwinia aphidicola]|uniref:hypothetical protein n=1 Tax=Erwinia aphidicola TaxID=68334 RepID=UPI0030CC5005